MDYAQAVQITGAPSDERRPLEEITDLADNLGRMNGSLSAFLMRSDGPAPVQLAHGEKLVDAPPCYRSEIGRLRRMVHETGELVDAINRLG